MKKIVSVGLVACAALLMCSCESEERVYSTYNPSVYYGMPQSEVDKVLSEKYSTINFGDEIKYDILISQDFMDIDPKFAVAPEVTYKFKDGKLDKITQTYDFFDGLPSNIADLYNTYLALALNVDEQELQLWSHEMEDGSVWVYFESANYYNEKESIFFISSNSTDGNIDSIDISFSRNESDS